MNEEAHNQLLLLTAGLFAVRLFRQSSDSVPITRAFFNSDEEWKEFQVSYRTEEAECAALDAVAIIAAVAKVESP